MRRLALLALLSACATQEANLGSTEHETARWAISLGDRGYETTSAVAFDSLGDVVVAGQARGWPADLGNGTIGSYGDWGFLTKRVASDGASRWSIAYPGTAPNAGASITSLAIGSDDSIVVGGAYTGTVDFGDRELATSGGDSFIAKYSPDGTLQWLWNMGADTGTQIRQVSLDRENNIFATCVYGYVAVDFLGNHPATSPQGTGCLISLDPTGTPRWGRFYDTAPAAYIETEGLTSTGDVVVTGEFTGSGSFGGATFDAATDPLGFIARYRNDGLYLWSHTLGLGNGRTGVPGLAIVGDDHIALNDYEAGGLTEFDGDGHVVWNNNNAPLGPLTARPNGDLVVSNWQEGGAQEPTVGHVEITAYDRSGHPRSGGVGTRVGEDGSTDLAASAVGPHGELAVVGEFSGSIDLGFGPLVTHGTDDTDAFVLVVEPPAN